MALVSHVKKGFQLPSMLDLRSQTRHLEKFRRKCGSHELYDLSANVMKRKRVELKNRTIISGFKVLCVNKV